MNMTLITYRKDSQAVHVMESLPSRAVFIRHENREGFTQYPIQYGDGRIAYDFPERVNKGIKPLIEKAFRAKNALEFIRRVDGWHTYARDVSSVIHDLQQAGKVTIFEAGRQYMAVNC